MRLISRVLGDTLSSECRARTTEAAVFTAPRKKAGLPVGSSRSNPNASQHPASEAMSRVLACLSESFTVRGAAMYPRLLDYADLIDAGDVADGERPGKCLLPRWQAQVQRENEVPRLSRGYLRTSESFEGSANTQSAFPGWSGRVTSCVTGFWSRICREWQIWSTVRQLQTLDDRTLEDIGIHRSQIESAALYRYRYTG
jgi:uncharacterized protein YjiS (DUF1127 family)